MHIKKHIKVAIILFLCIFMIPIQSYAKESIKHDSRFKGYKKERGVDVSQWQGEINWKKVAKDNVDYAIIRVAHRDPETGELEADKCAIENLKNAKKAGLKVGAYIFSQAISVEEAKEEAEYADKIIRKSKVELDLPLVMDFEYMSGWYGHSGRLYNAGLSGKASTNICISFLEVAEDLGYEPMVYASSWMMGGVLDGEKLSKIGKIWIAEYENQTSYKGTYHYWQYSATGKVSGIKGNVDLDYRYYQKNYKLSFRVKAPEVKNISASSTFDTLKLSWDEAEKADGYYIEKYDPMSTEYVRVKDIEKNSVTSWTDTKVNAGVPYTYRIQAYKIEGDYLGTGKYSKAFTYSTEDPVDGMILTNDVYVRREGKMSGDIISIFEQKTELKLVGGYGDWYKVRQEEYDIDGFVYKDFVGQADHLPEAPAIKTEAENFHTTKISWEEIKDVEGYIIQRYNADTEEFEDFYYETNPEITYCTDESLDAGKSGIYRVAGYTTIKEYKIPGDYSEEIKGTAGDAVKGKVKKNLKARKSADSSSKVMKTLKKGSKVKVIGVSGEYYKIKVKYKGKIRNSYVPAKYISL